MAEGYRITIETVFEDGKAVELPIETSMPVLREIIAASDLKSREAAAAGTAQLAQLDAEFREKQNNGRIEIEYVRVGNMALETIVGAGSIQQLQ